MKLVCSQATSSTDETGRRGLPFNCKQKGCTGAFSEKPACPSFANKYEVQQESIMRFGSTLSAQLA